MIPRPLIKDLHRGRRGPVRHASDPAAVERMAFPRLAAFAEVAWGTAGDYADFLRRLPGHLAGLDVQVGEVMP